MATARREPHEANGALFVDLNGLTAQQNSHYIRKFNTYLVTTGLSIFKS